MQWFKNLKIKVKLVIAFITIALLIGIVGAIGIQNMYLINLRTDDMYHQNFLPSQDLALIQKNLQFARSNFLLMIYERDRSLLQKRTDEINMWVEEGSRLLIEYEKTIDSPQKRNLFDNLMNEFTTYKSYCIDFINLLHAERYDETLSRMSDFTSARERYNLALGRLMEFNQKAAEDTAELNSESFKRQSLIMVAIILFGVAVAIFLGIVIANLITKPVIQLVDVADRIADGDLNVIIDIDTDDEIGILANAFNAMLVNINDVMTNINVAADQVASGSRQMSESSMALSEGATEQASSIQQLTASLEEIAAQTRLNAENANEANGLADSAKAFAIRGNDQMNQMLKAMDDINSASGDISKIIKVIDEIAFQTNILALNAAVEAARAGQHGKGFAVVAEEVRNLAARSANAAKETTIMIEGSIKKVESGTKIANETAGALGKIVEGVDKVAKLVNDIAAASNEQAIGIDQINQAIIQVSDVVQSNSATSEESAAASEELSSQAEILKEMVNRFKLKKNISSFKSQNDISPEVLRVLKMMSKKKKINMQSLSEAMAEAEVAATDSKPKIILNDREFGKY